MAVLAVFLFIESAYESTAVHIVRSYLRIIFLSVVGTAFNLTPMSLVRIRVELLQHGVSVPLVMCRLFLDIGLDMEMVGSRLVMDHSMEGIGGGNILSHKYS